MISTGQKLLMIFAVIAFSMENLYSIRGGGRGGAGLGQGRYGGTAGNIGSRSGMRTGINRNFSGASNIRASNFRQGQYRQRSNFNQRFNPNLQRPGQSGLNRQNRQFDFSNINRGFNRSLQQSARSLTPAANLQRQPGQFNQRNLSQRLNPSRLNPNRRNDPNYTRNFDLQRNFLNNNFRNHSWDWWWRNNPRTFWAYFPAAFYGSYGYYPPIYDDYYEMYQTYPSAVSVSEVYGPEYNLVTYDNTANQNPNQAQSCFDDCKGQCLNSGGGDYQCSQSCEQQCA